jgi:hypothetical protein
MPPAIPALTNAEVAMFLAILNNPFLVSNCSNSLIIETDYITEVVRSKLVWFYAS